MIASVYIYNLLRIFYCRAQQKQRLANTSVTNYSKKQSTVNMFATNNAISMMSHRAVPIATWAIRQSCQRGIYNRLAVDRSNFWFSPVENNISSIRFHPSYGSWRISWTEFSAKSLARANATKFIIARLWMTRRSIAVSFTHHRLRHGHILWTVTLDIVGRS